MAADRRGERGLTDVSLCRVCYLHYFDIIIPVALYLTAPSLFCSGAHPAHRCAIAYRTMRGVLLYQSSSFLFFFYFILMTVLLHAARAHAREDYNAGCR